MKLAGRRRAGHDRRRPSTSRFARRRRRHHPDHLRRRRGRRRHGRRRRPADADLGVPADGRRVLRQRRRRARPGQRPRRPRPPVAARPSGRGAQSAEAAPGCFVAPPRRRPRRRAGATSSRASPSAPGWSCSASSPALASSRPAPVSGDLSVASTGARRRPPPSGAGEISARELLDLHLDADRRAQPASSTRSSRSTRSGPASAPRPPTRRWPPVTRWARCTGCRSRSRTPTTWRAGARPTARRCYADHVPDADDLVVERIRACRASSRSARPTCRSSRPARTPSTPSSGPPATRSTRRRSAGGSSGGAACALASGHGAARRRLGHGRLAAQPGVVLRRGRAAALARPGPGVADRTTSGRRTSVGGPMARNVGDLALLLSVIAGPGPRAPQALGDPGATFAPPLTRPLAGLRVACRSTSAAPSRSTTRSRRVVARAPARSSPAAARRVAAAHPDLAEADDTFRTLRAWHFQAGLGPLLAAHPDAFKPSLADNIRAGEPLTGADVARAYAQRTALSERMRAVLRRRTTCWCCRPRRCRRSRPTRSTRPRSTASRWRPTSTGCARPTSSPSPAARRSPCPRVTRATGCPSASRWSPRHGVGPAAARGRCGASRLRL